MTVLQQLVSYTLILDDYISRNSETPPLAVVGDLRNFVQHQLMSLMPITSGKGNDVLYLSLRASVIYSLACVFPIPYAPFKVLVWQMKACLDRVNTQSGWERVHELMLWNLCMAGIASTGMQDRQYFVAMLARGCAKLQIRSWTAFRDTMERFLWLSCTNDQDGLSLWQEIESSWSGENN